jgi:hypothetical protein
MISVQNHPPLLNGNDSTPRAAHRTQCTHEIIWNFRAFKLLKDYIELKIKI